MFRRLIARLLVIMCFLIAVNAIALYYHSLAPDSRASYRALHRKTNIIDSLAPPRLIVVGGSSVMYGQNTRLFEEELHTHVVNMGTHAGIGLRYMMTNVLPHLRRGDIVLLAPEYAQFTGTFNGWHPLLDLLIQNPDALRNITTLGQVHVLIEALPTKLKQPLDRRVNTMLFGEQTDESSSSLLKSIPPDTIRDSPGYHGDTWNRERTQRLFPLKDWYPITSEYLDMAAVRGISEFIRECAARNIFVLLDYPPIPARFYDECAPWILRLHSILLKEFPGVVLRHPRDSAYPEHLFLDTVYHLNAIGRDQRTRDLACALRSYLVSHPSNSSSGRP